MLPSSGTSCDAGLLLADHHAADHHGAAVFDQHLGLRRLRIQSGHAIDLVAEVDLGVFHDHVQEDGSVGGDLRRHLQRQHRVDVLSSKWCY